MSIVENKKAKSFLAFLTIVLILLGIIVPALAAMEQKGRIISFEKASPVYIGTVAQGTEQEDLGLPKTLRATVDTQDVVGNFAGGVHIVPLMTTLERWWTCL